jgi:hypothetical protein
VCKQHLATLEDGKKIFWGTDLFVRLKTVFVLTQEQKNQLGSILTTFSFQGPKKCTKFGIFGVQTASGNPGRRKEKFLGD